MAVCLMALGSIPALAPGSETKARHVGHRNAGLHRKTESKAKHPEARSLRAQTTPTTGSPAPTGSEPVPARSAVWEFVPAAPDPSPAAAALPRPRPLPARDRHPVSPRPTVTPTWEETPTPERRNPYLENGVPKRTWGKKKSPGSGRDEQRKSPARP